MAVSIAPNSAQINITSRPVANRPRVDLANSVAVFDSGAMSANGQVTLNGSAGDSTAGWEVGWVQAQWIETNWGYYRGQHNNDGSLFIQRARPPARAAQACRDTSGPVTDIFTDLAAPEWVNSPAGAFPLIVRVSTTDPPSDSWDLIENNTLTGQQNFLREAQLEFHFCTVLTVRDPAGTFHHQASFYWNLRWQARFRVGNFASLLGTPWIVNLTAGGNGAAVSGIIRGRPTDARFAGVLTSAQTNSCNDLFQAATAAVQHPGSPNRRQSRVWDNFDVRR